MGSTRTDILNTALARADLHGIQSVTVTAITKELGIQPPALYKHFDGASDLEREMKLVAIRELRDRLSTSAIGVARDDAVQSMMIAMRSFAKDHPARYQLTVAANPEDPEIVEAGMAIVNIVTKVLVAYGFPKEESIHMTRMMRSVIHGFVSLELAGGFGLLDSVDETFERLVDMTVRELKAHTRP